MGDETLIERIEIQKNIILFLDIYKTLERREDVKEGITAPELREICFNKLEVQKYHDTLSAKMKFIKSLEVTMDEQGYGLT